jgi:hypothetical protein
MDNIFKVTYQVLGYLQEDMFQAEYGNLILDLGYYWDWYLKLQVIKDQNWEKPIEKVSFLSSDLIELLIEVFKKKIINGDFSWNYKLNEGYEKEV